MRGGRAKRGVIHLSTDPIGIAASIGVIESAEKIDPIAAILLTWDKPSVNNVAGKTQHNTKERKIDEGYCRSSQHESLTI